MFTIFLPSFCAYQAIQKGHISIYELNYSVISEFSFLLSLDIKINPITNSDLGGGGLYSASTTFNRKHEQNVVRSGESPTLGFHSSFYFVPAFLGAD